jgi:hypothetical protein
MLLSSQSVPFYMSAEILANSLNRFAGYNLSGAHKSFLGLDISVKGNGLGFFHEYARARKYIVGLSVCCPPADSPSSEVFYVAERSHCDTFLPENLTFF